MAGLSAAAPHLELVGIQKRFGPLVALADVSLSLLPGTVHALVGENGAGKSTLGRIMAGVTAPDGGRILLHGREVTLGSPRAALGHRIAAVAQELTIVDSLSVAENVFLGHEPRAAGVVRRRTLHRRYEDLAASTGFELSGRASAGALRTAEKQQVEILRALSHDAELLVMDEPTAALNGAETAQLHTIIRRLTATGHTVVLVSHFLGEVLELADTISVLRDGRVVRTSPAIEETRDSLVHAMLGRSLGAAYPTKRPAERDAAVVLSARGLCATAVVDVDLDVREGEILGLAGLVGAGRSELAQALCGASRRSAGQVTVSGTGPLGPGTIAAKRAGVIMIAESRQDQGLLPARSVRENISVAALGRLSRSGVINRTKERTVTDALLREVSVRPDAASLPVSALSGGNQQKVLFARALLCKPRVLIADEPTRGVDIGARRAIYDTVVALAAAGTAVILISSELEEILEVAHRVLVVRAGRIVDELCTEELSEDRVLSAAFGQTAGPAGPPTIEVHERSIQ